MEDNQTRQHPDVMANEDHSQDGNVGSSESITPAIGEVAMSPSAESTTTTGENSPSVHRSPVEDFMLAPEDGSEDSQFRVNEEKFGSLETPSAEKVQAYLGAHLETFDRNKLPQPEDDQPLSVRDRTLLARQEKIESNILSGVKSVGELFREGQITKASEVQDLIRLYSSRFRETQKHRIKKELALGMSTRAISNAFYIFDNLNDMYQTADEGTFKPVRQTDGSISLSAAKDALNLSGIDSEEIGAGEAVTEIFFRAQRGSGLPLFDILRSLKVAPEDGQESLNLDDFINCSPNLRKQMSKIIAKRQSQYGTERIYTAEEYRRETTMRKFG